MEKYGTLTVRLMMTAMALTALACQREEGARESSSITIQMPTEQQLFGKVGTLAAIPSGRKICYAVNITAPDISSNTNSCQPSLGVTAGFVESGQAVSVEVKTGENRKIDLYMHLKATGDNSACPSLKSSLDPSLLSSTYLVGTVAGLSLQDAEVNVSIPVSFPGESSHIAQSFGLPASCLPDPGGPQGKPKSIAAATGTVENVGNNIKLNARVGVSIHGMEASSASYKMKVNAQ